MASLIRVGGRGAMVMLEMCRWIELSRESLRALNIKGSIEIEGKEIGAFT